MNAAIGPKLPLNLDKKNGFLMIEKYSEEIKQNIKTLFLTCPGEKIRDLNFGLGLRNYLFENVDYKAFEDEIRFKASEQVEKYMPFVTINSLDIYNSPDIENTIFIKFDYFIQPLNLEDQLTLSFIQ